MIEVKNLVKRYGDHVAVDDLSFVVNKGQILGFLGPNGAGKSTTMNVITGYISATEGSVSINGYDIFEEPEEAKKNIGYLPEQPPLYMDMKVIEYLNFVAEIKGVKKDIRAKMVQNIMQDTKLLNVQQRLIRHLSKGYKQRTGLAGALMGYPEVIILDEPTVGLDPMQIIEIRDLIKSLSKKHTIILSSHILSEVSAMCDVVMIINKGRLVVSDAPENLSKHIKGSNGVKLSVKGSKESVAEALSKVGEITETKYDILSTKNIVEVSVFFDQNLDLREDIFYALAKAECPIFEMKSMNMSLEDIFLQVTKEDDLKGTKLRKTNFEKEEALHEINEESAEIEVNESDESNKSNKSDKSDESNKLDKSDESIREDK